MSNDQPARSRPSLVSRLARTRVALGFACGAAVFWLATPAPATIAIGATVAIAGEGIRFWAAGHLNKAREVTTSGPYRWFAHPLYLGSTFMGLGLAIACGRVSIAVLIAIYVVVTLGAAIRSEEAFLRRAFGHEYDRYRRGRSDRQEAPKRFSWRQALANHEHRAVAGLLAAVLLLVLKATYNGSFWR